MNVEQVENSKNSLPEKSLLNRASRSHLSFFINLKYRKSAYSLVLFPYSLCSHRNKYWREKMQIEMWYPNSDSVRDCAVSSSTMTGFCYLAEKTWYQYKRIVC